jgi:4'-phosphopantetheinyl transferase
MRDPGSSRPWTEDLSPPTPLAPNVVHVLRVDLAAVGSGVFALLSHEEIVRANGIVRQRPRELWMRARGLLRALLGAYLDCDPRTLPLLTTANGKPFLDTTPTVAFNLAHSGRHALYAITNGPSVGVDIEAPRPTTQRLPELALARRALGPEQAGLLEQLNAAERRREFLRLWARHEAALKCLGTGLAGAPSEHPELWVSDLRFAPHAAAAIALEDAPQELRLWGLPSACPRLAALQPLRCNMAAISGPSPSTLVAE